MDMLTVPLSLTGLLVSLARPGPEPSELGSPPPTLVDGCSPAGTSRNPAAVQFCLDRSSLSLSPWQPARAVAMPTCERRTRANNGILTELGA